MPPTCDGQDRRRTARCVCVSSAPTERHRRRVRCDERPERDRPFERLTFDKPTWPDFDPAATDYVIECGAGAGVADVTIGLGLLPSTAAYAVRRRWRADSGRQRVGDRADADGRLVRRVDDPTQASHATITSAAFRSTSRGSTVIRPGNPTPGWYLTTFGFSSPAIGEFVGDPRQLRCPGLVQADLARGHRLQATVGRSRWRSPRRTGRSASSPEQGYWATNLQGSSTERFRTTDPGGAAHRPPRLPRDPGRTRPVELPAGDGRGPDGRSARVPTPTRTA